MARQLSKLAPGLLAAVRGCSSLGCFPAQAMAPAFKLLSSCDTSFRTLHTSFSSQIAQDTDLSKGDDPNRVMKTYEPSRKFRPLADKELWHESWMYEDRFGTEEEPIIVPSLEPERIIGCTDPEDDNLVVWGILRENEPPRQFIEGGEYYLLKIVPYVAKVGDILDQLEANEKESIPN